MASVIEFRIPVSQFALATTIETVSELRLEIERFVARDPDSVMPYVWTTTEDFEAFEQAVAEDATVEDSTLLTEGDGERLYQMEWVLGVEAVLYMLLKKGGAVKSANVNTSSGAWELQVMCPEHGMLSEIYRFCEENGLSLTVDAIYELDSNQGSEHGLTETQYESLTAAKERGYYDVPRTITLSELADDLDVSHQALSERLRRGHANLIDRTVGSPATSKTE